MKDRMSLPGKIIIGIVLAAFIIIVGSGIFDVVKMYQDSPPVDRTLTIDEQYKDQRQRTDDAWARFYDRLEELTE